MEECAAFQLSRARPDSCCSDFHEDRVSLVRLVTKKIHQHPWESRAIHLIHMCDCTHAVRGREHTPRHSVHVAQLCISDLKDRERFERFRRIGECDS